MKISYRTFPMIALAATLGHLSQPVAAQGAAEQSATSLVEVASFPNQQVTGVAVSKEGRVFVNFPYWSDNHSTSVAELGGDGVAKPFPDEKWQAKEGDPAKRWVCVQSVYVDDTNALWILDPAAPKMEAVVKGGAKLVKYDLTEREVAQVIQFPDDAVPERSYLNDVRVDTKRQIAYLTDSGLGAICIVDLKSGKIRRLLNEHPAVKAEPELKLVVDGITLLDPKTGKTPQIHSDGIALSRDGETLYFHALTGHTLYRIKTEHLRDESLEAEDLARKVEKVTQTAAPDGMLLGPDGSIYLAAFEINGIERYNPDSGKVETMITDKKLQWPDSLSWGPGGWMYVTTSQIHRTPKFNEGQNKQLGPFQVLKFRPGK